MTYICLVVVFGLGYLVVFIVAIQSKAIATAKIVTERLREVARRTTGLQVCHARAHAHEHAHVRHATFRHAPSPL